MISIIICSIKPHLLYQLTKNIRETIDVDYEILAHDNRETNWGICKVYNYCAEKARFNHLVFCHEDILFHTFGWGKILIELLNKEQIGLIGVSGAVYKSQYPTSWTAVPQKYYRTNAIQRLEDGTNYKSEINPQNANVSEVAVVDGLFLSVKKELFNNYPFNEKDLKGFHLYDMDYSSRINKSYKVIVSHQILIEHFSLGKLDKNWFLESIKWHKQNTDLLPISSIPLSKEQKKDIKISCLKSVILNCYKTNCCIVLMLKHLFKLIYKAPFSGSTFVFIKYVLSYSLGIPKIKKVWK